MIENSNTSKSSNGIEYDIKKYIGVASVNVLAINPNNATLRKYGWQIPQDAEEPEYTTTVERNGKQIKAAKVRFLVQIMDIDPHPVIALDFWVRGAYCANKENNKFKVIDHFGRKAWLTKEEVNKKFVPKFESGDDMIALPYAYSKEGEEELIAFIFKYLNITPFQIWDRAKGKYVNSPNPGKLTIDDWAKLCNGDVSEIKGYMGLQPDNKVKVVLGVRDNSENNRSYQAFLNTVYIGNGASPDPSSGAYTAARKEIDRFMQYHSEGGYHFEATPVREYKETPTEVKDNSSDMPSDFDMPTSEPSNDLPFDFE